MISMDTQSTLKAQALAALSTVIDPELGVNIVDLGLIYDFAYDADLKLCTVTMTLTIMGCPLTGYLNDHIKSALMTVAGIDQVIRYSSTLSGNRPGRLIKCHGQQK